MFHNIHFIFDIHNKFFIRFNFLFACYLISIAKVGCVSPVVILYCPMRNSDEMTIGKTQSTLQLLYSGHNSKNHDGKIYDGNITGSDSDRQNRFLFGLQSMAIKIAKIPIGQSKLNLELIRTPFRNVP